MFVIFGEDYYYLNASTKTLDLLIGITYIKILSMVNKNLLTLLLLIISLMSCDYRVKEYYIIENKTGFYINVAFVEKYENDKKDTINEIVKTNAIKSFYVNSTLTGMAKSKGSNYLA